MSKMHLPVIEGQKVGVYVCHCGGNISDVIDVAGVAKSAGEQSSVAVARDFVFMCSDQGQNMIIEDIQKHGVERVVVAACSPALHESTFRRAMAKAGLNPYVYQHVNIREQASWVHKADNPGATKKADALVSAGIAGVGAKSALRAIAVTAQHHVVVVGGGLAGMRSALALASMGVPVTIIESSDRLGGRLRTIGSLHQSGKAASEVAERLEKQVRSQKQIEICTATKIEKVSGFVGSFVVHLVSGDTVTCGALVLATGHRLYEPGEGEFGFGHERVVSLEDFSRELLTDKSSRKQLQFKGNPIRSIAFVHCVGSRQVAGVHEPGPDGKINEYCSRVCCSAILHAMRTIGERFPDTQVYDFYRDIRTYGRGQEAIYEQVSKLGALFFRFTATEPPVVTPAESGDNATLRVTVKDVLTWNEQVAVGVDLVVLAAGMVPADITSLVDSLKLPIGSDRFLLEAHPKLRPAEIATNGIFLAGTCQAPMDATEAAAAAGAAASKAAILLSQSELQLDPFVAEVNRDKCTGCGDCLAECSYEGAIALEKVGEKMFAAVNAALCKGCGACAAVCKERALDVAGWSIEQMESMVDAIAAS